MRRLALSLGMLASLALAFAAPAAAAERDVRILSVEDAYGTDLSDVQSLRYDPVTRTLTVTFTLGCWISQSPFDDTSAQTTVAYAGLIASQRDATYDSYSNGTSTSADPVTDCERTFVSTITGIMPGRATIVVDYAISGWNFFSDQITYEVIL
jgi:hypothetical protein